MFKRDNDNSSAASTLRLGESQPVRSKNVSVIGPTLVFKGELSADEDLVIEGIIEGTIAHQKKNLTIGKKGRVTANIHANSVLIEGELNGDIHSDGLVSMSRDARVNGNVHCARLVMEDGAQFTGNIEMVTRSPVHAVSDSDDAFDEFGEPGNLSA